MSRPTTRLWDVRTAVATVAVLYAAAALAVLATASTSKDRAASGGAVQADPLEPRSLGR